MSQSLAWTETVPASVVESLTPKTRAVLMALRQLHREEEGD